MEQSHTLESKLAEGRKAAAERFPQLTDMIDRLAAELEESTAKEALAEGDRAPDFELRRADNDEPVRLSEQLQHGPVVLSFYRGQWCPYCNLELQALQQAYPEIQSLGAEVFFVGPETRDDARKLMDKQHASIPLLYDRDGSVIRSYRIAFELPDFLRPAYSSLGFPDANPETGWLLPIPATYVIDQEGIVRNRHLNPNYTYRMEPRDIIQALKESQRPGVDREGARAG